MSTFNLAVVRPVDKQAGELMFTRSVNAESISAAVKQVRMEVEGTGFLVMQESAYLPARKALPDTAITYALVKAYDQSIAA